MRLTSESLHVWAMLAVHVLGAILIMAVIGFLWQAQRSRTSPFDAAEMFEDERGKTSGPRLVYVVCAFAAVWVMIFLTVADRITGEVIGLILGILMLGKVGSQFLDSRGPPQPASEEMTIKRTGAVEPKPVDDVPTLTDVVIDPRPKRGAKP